MFIDNILYRQDHCQRIYASLKRWFLINPFISTNTDETAVTYQMEEFPPSLLTLNLKSMYFLCIDLLELNEIYFCCENLLNSTHSPSWLWVWMYFLCTDLDVSYHTHCIIYSCLCMNEWVKLKQSGVRYKLLRMEHINCSWCHNIRKLGIGKIFEHHNGIRLINNSVCAPFVIEQQRWLDSCTIQIFVWIE